MYRIAISGKANSGKNTTANLLLQELAKLNGKEQLISDVIAFADPIKEIVLRMFPKAVKEFLYGRSDLRSLTIPDALDNFGNPLTYRQALIDIGTMGRRYNPNIWVNHFDKTFENIKLNKNIEAIIVPDVRFKEELEYLKKEGFFIIKLKRNNELKINHDSETIQDAFIASEFDDVIINNDGIDDLRNKIKADVACKIQNHP